jgi:voltage-gated potassium channel
MRIKSRLIVVLLAILIINLVGSIGYYLLFGGQVSLMDCLFMTVISLTSVGYGEVVPITGNPAAEWFTILLILFGMGIILYGISSLTAILVEGELSGLLRRKKMEKKISRLQHHIIVCGGGETGQPVLDELGKNREAAVLIEKDPDKIERLSAMGELLYIEGDATDDANLLLAGIDRAAGLITCLPSDKDNLFVTMSARMLNPRLRIISRMVDARLEPKLKKAGADRMVSPNSIGALRMASEMIRPTAVDFLDSMLRSKKGDLRISQINVTAASSLLGKPLKSSGIRTRHNLLVLAARDDHNEMVFNPAPDSIISKDMVLIVMGAVDDIEAARRVF